MTPWRSPSVAAALLVGVLVGAVFGATVLSPAGGTSPPDPESPPFSYSTGTGCVPDAHVDSGWLVATTHGNARVVTFNLTVAHDADEDATAALRRRSPGRYVLAVSTVPATDGKPGAPDDCTYGSTVQGSVSLPTDYDELTVVHDGTVLGTVRNDGTTTARHWTLHLPANASG